MPDVIVETGAVVDNANSYITVDEFKAFHKDRGINIDADTRVVQSCVIEGTSYVDLKWGNRFKGSISNTDQLLSFPRVDLFDNQGREVVSIPDKIKKAAILYAKEYLDNSLFQSQPTNTQRVEKKKKTSVGTISTEVEYETGTLSPLFRRFPAADSLCREFTDTFVRLVR